jgi:heptosyltransferase-2
MIYDRDGQEKGFVGKFKFLQKVRKERYDLFINLHIPSPQRRFLYYFRDNLFAFLTGAKYRVGYWVRGTGVWLTHGLLADNMDRRPAADAMIALANCIITSETKVNKSNIEYDDYSWIIDVDEHGTDMLLKNCGISKKDLLIGIHPGSKHEYARWLSERFAQLGDELVFKYNAKVIFTGSVNDVSLVKEIAALMKKDAILFSGRTSLRQLAALIKRCRIYISVDTGPLHMAVAVRTPTVSLFSGRDFSKKWAPNGDTNIVIRKDVECSPCFKNYCNNNVCMKKINVSDVLEAVEKQLTISEKEQKI